MADCNETLNELYNFLDGELGPDVRNAVQHHLDDCMDCLQVFDFHAELRQVIKAKCVEQHIPPGLMERVKGCFGPETIAEPNGS